jgi:hypothetical protein
MERHFGKFAGRNYFLVREDEKEKTLDDLRNDPAFEFVKRLEQLGEGTADWLTYQYCGGRAGSSNTGQTGTLQYAQILFYALISSQAGSSANTASAPQASGETRMDEAEAAPMSDNPPDRIGRADLDFLLNK